MCKVSRRTAVGLLSGAALAPGLGGCASSETVSAADTRPGDAAFNALAADALDGWARLNPSAATQLGDHRFDAEIDDLSASGRARRAAFYREKLAALEALAPTTLSRDAQIDRAMLRNRFQFESWTDDSAKSWEWDPLPYNGAAGDSLYTLIARDFAPLPERLNNAAARMEKLPALLAQARAELAPERVPSIHAQTYAQQHAGLMEIVDGLILPNVAELGPADRTRLQAAAERLRAEAATHQAWINGTLAPQARGDFRLGAALYDQKLALALDSPLTRQELRARATSEIERIRQEMAEIASSVVTPPANERWSMQRMIQQGLERAYAERPARADVVPACYASLERATQFVRTKDLITLPDTPVEIIIMPEFQQGVAVAYCDSPGALDRDQPTFYAVSPIPDEWTEAQVSSFLREYNSRSIHELTIHEAMPGHYVQLWHSNRHASVPRAAFYSGVFVEGWACYAQDMMTEQGYYEGDPLGRLINLKWALRVVTNAVLDSAVHVDGASREDAMQLMVETGFQEEREAAGKWTRAQLSSTQLSTYFVGWTEHHALRREAEQRQGAGFNLKRYHDGVLSFGSPPVRYARAMYLNEPIPV
jgi:uncharacterized protein (DUF885 family)